MKPYDQMDKTELMQALARKDRLLADAARKEGYCHAFFARMNIGFQLGEIICDDAGVPRDYRFLETNDYFEKETGINTVDLMGKRVLELFPDVESFWIEVYGKVALTGEPTRFEYFNHNTGRYYEVFAFSPVLGQFAALGKDITPRKQAEAEIVRSESRYRSLFMSIREGFCLTQVLSGDTSPCDFRFSEVNPAFEQITGIEGGQVVGKRLAEVFPEVSSVLMEILTQVSLSGSPSYCCYFSEPVRRYFEILVFKINADQVAALFSDITEHRQTDLELRTSDKRLRLFIELAPVSIAMFDRDMRYISASRCWSEAHHLGDLDLTGRSHYDVLPEIGPEWREAHRRGLAGEVLRSDCDRFERSDGSVQWMRWEIQPWHDKSGSVEGIVLFAEDITEHKLMQNELEKAKVQLERKVKERTAELESAVRDLQSFSFSVSHDLRAPLRHINSFSAMLLEDCGSEIPERGRDYLERIAAASNRMGNLIDSLLKLSRVSRAEIRWETVDLSRMAASILGTFQAAEPERRVETVVRDGIDAVGDRTLLLQLLENLLGNAWKYTSSNPLARIEFGMVAQSGEAVYFVKDNGVGFEMEYRGKLFEAFERLHGADFEGLGIGLATAKKIVERHLGDIRAEGEVGKGSVFYFTLRGAVGGTA